MLKAAKNTDSFYNATVYTKQRKTIWLLQKTRVLPRFLKNFFDINNSRRRVYTKTNVNYWAEQNIVIYQWRADQQISFL